MTWAKVDDRLHHHRKIRRAGPEAMGLWVVALSFCADHMTDGLVLREDAEGLAQRLGVAPKRIEKFVEIASARLVAAELWAVAGDGSWCFHDWSDCQPMRAELQQKRVQGQRAAHARWNADGTADDDADRNPPANPRPDPDPDPGPDLPLQEKTIPSGADSQREPSPPPEDPWGLGNGSDPDEPPEPEAPPGKARRAQKPDLERSQLSGWQRQIADAIIGDASLAPICPRPLQLARDLALAAPAVDIAREVRGLGAWMRQNPTRKKKNGGAFLLRCIARKQEAGGTRGWTPPASASEPERAPPATPPPRPEVAALRVDPSASADDLFARIGAGDEDDQEPPAAAGGAG